MSELKPCPFCGSDAVLETTYSAGGIGGNGYYIRCKSCGNTGPFDLGKSGAIAIWQSRPIEDALRARIAELERKPETGGDELWQGKNPVVVEDAE